MGTPRRGGTIKSCSNSEGWFMYVVMVVVSIVQYGNRLSDFNVTAVKSIDESWITRNYREEKLDEQKMLGCEASHSCLLRVRRSK